MAPTPRAAHGSCAEAEGPCPHPSLVHQPQLGAHRRVGGNRAGAGRWDKPRPCHFLAGDFLGLSFVHGEVGKLRSLPLAELLRE